jgi:hypothetical protein
MQEISNNPDLLRSRESNPDIKETVLVRSQALVHLINAHVCYCVWPRAGGKTSGGIGPRLVHLSEVMPRSQVLLVADSFERIEKVLWPSIESFINHELGLVADVDYVVHKKPPEHWTKPYFIPAKYDHVICFATGFCLCEVSLNVSGSGNGFNAQAVIGDEIKYWDEAKFKSEVRPAIRGGMKRWGHLPEFRSMWFFTDKFPSKGANIHWVLAKKKECNFEDADIVYTLQLEVLRLQDEIEQLSSNEAKYERLKKIEQYEEVIRIKRMKLIYYSDALPYENMENLGEEYFDELRRDLSAYEYEVAIENKDPDKAIEPFYPDLLPVHFYKSKSDCDPNKALAITLDYQYSITPVVTGQFGRLQGSPYTTFNFVNSLHKLHPEGIKGAIKAWCDDKKNHKLKLVHYLYNHTAIGRSPYGTTFKDLVVESLIQEGWSVVEHYMGDAPDHDIKYEINKKHLANHTDGAIRINEEGNSYMKKSIEMTDAVLVNGKTKKDKSSEKSKKTPPELSTHYSDAFDDMVWGALELKLVPMSDDAGIDITARH